MNYPAAYCVRCKEYTDASAPHTVMLKNNSRALTGVCPKCSSQVYLIMPKKEARSSGGDKKSIYKLDTVFSHTAYCVKCKKHTRVNYAHGVVFQNGRKAVRGQCESCGCDAYKILKERIVIRDVSAKRRLSHVTATSEEKFVVQDRSRWLKYVGLLFISAALGAFMAYYIG